MAPIDWNQVFGLQTNPFEIVLRGSIVYLSLFFMFRVVGKRHAGAIGVPDVLVIVLVADAIQNAMAGTYVSVTDGLVLVATILFWNELIDWLSFRSRFLARVLEAPPVTLIRDGELQRRNMRRELVTEEELAAQLREQGLEDFSRVKLACIESDGRISIIQRDISRDSDQHGRPEGPPV